MKLTAFSAALGSVFLLASGEPTENVRRKETSEPLLPSQDPFYTAPPNWEQTAPGTILRIRTAPGNVTTVIANTSAVWNIVYRTTDSNYKPSWAVTTVLAPLQNVSAPDNGTHNSLLSLQIAYNTAYPDSTPSIMLYGAASAPTFGGPSTADDIAYMLGKGWYVTIPDHEGPLASFGLGVQEGHATIDSIRATLNSDILPKQIPTKYAMWGYSGGSVASSWAAELQEQYAPELKFAGMAIGGLVPNITKGLQLSGTPFAGLIPGLFLGITSQDAEAREYLVSRLKTSGPYNATGFLAALRYDVGTLFLKYPGQEIGEYFVGGLADLRAPVLERISRSNTWQGYHGIPQTPVFVYKAIQDEFSPVSDSDELVQRWCGIDVDVRYERNEVGEHIDEINNGRLRALEWLETVFDGTLEKTGCDVRNVSVAVNTGI
ncbi:LIP-domain-containing protein [Periconia macrospinosa]|uniref:LIP-domain-containing protein n=1 Tax=Periconia macrospinosa TaxID=97972 RepID=A0A2V1DU92_9PLEO|nr:LIP-domain-containing protein [Periconia macrospinosa]